MAGCRLCPRLAWLLLLLAALSACAAERQPPEALVGSRWRAEEIAGRGVIDGARSTLSFERLDRVAGNGGCNGFQGLVELTGETIVFGPLASTRRACAPAVDEQERRFLEALAASRRFRLGPGRDQLLLDDAAGRTLVRFSRRD